MQGMTKIVSGNEGDESATESGEGKSIKSASGADEKKSELLRLRNLPLVDWHTRVRSMYVEERKTRLEQEVARG